jgi:hypothetical protein
MWVREEKKLRQWTIAHKERMHFMTVSNVTRIQKEIELAYLAGRWGLSGLASGTSQHRFITARMERIEEGRQELQAIVGDQAIAIVSDTLSNLPEEPTRYHIQSVLQHELGDTEATAHLLDYLQEAWETFDMLIERFGQEDAHKIMNVPGISPVGIPAS